MLVMRPGFAAVAVLTLALGIGANTAIFSVAHTVLAPLPIAEADRVVMVWTENPARGWHQFPASVPDFEDWKASGVFSHLAGYTDAGFNLRLGDRTERLNGARVTAEICGVIQSRPRLGRGFEAEDMRPGHDQAAILSDSLWRSHFGADPGIVGRTIVLDGRARIVAGVLPPDFPKFGKEEIYTPLVFDAEAAGSRGSRSFGAVGRLRPGLSLAVAQQRMTALSARLAKEDPHDTGNTALLQPIQEAFVQDAQTLVMILFATVGCLLLIACANIASLLLARATGREREMAIRTALGANGWALFRQLLTESVLVALAGGALAILPAVWGVSMLSSLQMDELPNLGRVSVNLSALGFNFLLAAGTGVLFGLVPAWQARKADVITALKGSSRTTAGAVHQRLRGLFVVGEIALALVLLVAAGLMAQSFLRLRAANLGYNPHGILMMQVALSDQKYDTPQKQAAFYDAVLERVRALAGVRSAGASDQLPTSGDLHGAGLFLADKPEPRPEDVPVVLRTTITPDCLRAMEIPLVSGRYLEERDGPAAPLVALVDQYTARRYWPNQDAVGQRFKLGSKQPLMQIVGVVGNADQGLVVKVVKGQLGQIYVPSEQAPKTAMTLVVRAGGDPLALTGAIRNVVSGVDIDQPVFGIQTLDEAQAASRASQRLAAVLIGGFAVVGLLLATIGIAGVVAFNAAQRTREFGIRVALGARPADVLRIVVRQALVLSAAGAALGLGGGLLLARAMRGLLYGVGASDPLTFGSVVVLFTLVAAVASWVPARRAVRMDPLTALRWE
jgi:putative ABC transport system permease protein